MAIFKRNIHKTSRRSRRLSEAHEDQPGIIVQGLFVGGLYGQQVDPWTAVTVLVEGKPKSFIALGRRSSGWIPHHPGKAELEFRGSGLRVDDMHISDLSVQVPTSGHVLVTFLAPRPNYFRTSPDRMAKWNVRNI